MKQFSWWQICIVALSVGVAASLPLAAAKGLPIPFSWPTVREWIDIGKLFISWPVAIAVFAYVFFRLYEEEIRSYLQRLGRIKVAGFIEAEPQQLQLPVVSESIERDGGKGTQTGGLRDEIGGADATNKSGGAPGIEVEPLPTNDDGAALSSGALGSDFGQNERISALEKEVEEWRFAYFERLFVEYTKRVLVWLAVMPQPRSVYEYIWQYVVPSGEQKNTVLGVLKKTGMIEETSAGLLRVTSQGAEFIEYMRRNGQLPGQPIPSVSAPFVPADKPSDPVLADAADESRLWADAILKGTKSSPSSAVPLSRTPPPTTPPTLVNTPASGLSDMLARFVVDKNPPGK